MKNNKSVRSSITTTTIRVAIAAVTIFSSISVTGCSDNATNSATVTVDDADNDTVQEMVGNPDLDLSKLPPNIANALRGINKVVSSTEDCSGANVKVAIPKDWQCRKLDKNANDFTLYTDGNRLNVTIGTGQGMTSCSVIPTCSSEPVVLSNKFAETTIFIQPMIGSVEITGTWKDDPRIKFLVTSNDSMSADEMTQVSSILDSLEPM